MLSPSMPSASANCTAVSTMRARDSGVRVVVDRLAIGIPSRYGAVRAGPVDERTVYVYRVPHRYVQRTFPLGGTHEGTAARSVRLIRRPARRRRRAPRTRQGP